MPDRKQSEDGSPSQLVRSLYEQAESESARAFEELVSRPSFGALLAHSAENVAALTRIGADVSDLVLRNLRIAGRADIARLARQLHRTEDKLERVLQEVEQLRDEVGHPGGPTTSNGNEPSPGDSAAPRRSSRATRGSSRAARGSSRAARGSSGAARGSSGTSRDSAAADR